MPVAVSRSPENRSVTSSPPAGGSARTGRPRRRSGPRPRRRSLAGVALRVTCDPPPPAPAAPRRRCRPRAGPSAPGYSRPAPVTVQRGAGERAASSAPRCPTARRRAGRGVSVRATFAPAAATVVTATGAPVAAYAEPGGGRRLEAPATGATVTVVAPAAASAVVVVPTGAPARRAWRPARRAPAMGSSRTLRASPQAPTLAASTVSVFVAVSRARMRARSRPRRAVTAGVGLSVRCGSRSRPSATVDRAEHRAVLSADQVEVRRLPATPRRG